MAHCLYGAGFKVDIRDAIKILYGDVVCFCSVGLRSVCVCAERKLCWSEKGGQDFCRLCVSAYEKCCNMPNVLFILIMTCHIVQAM